MATLSMRIASLVAVTALVSSVAVVIPETVVNAENNPNISIGDAVWLDLNGNGEYDAGEPGRARARTRLRR